MQTLKKKGGDNSSYSLEKTLVLKSLIPFSGGFTFIFLCFCSFLTPIHL